MSALFSPLQVGNLQLQNRIVIAPMCQFSAEDGCMTDWHLIHLGNLSHSGAALLTIEATTVTPEGRISYDDVGLYSDENEAAMARVLAGVRRWSEMPIAIQLGHAGRKASTEKPWLGGHQIAPTESNGWQTVAPSEIAWAERENEPHELDRDEIARIRSAFADAAARASKLELDAVQIHAAHGYLLHQFLSPLSNHRTDDYGGTLENRMRFPLEVFESVRKAFSADRPVTVRLSGTDWVDGGWTLEDTIAFAVRLEGIGCSAIHVSSGGLHPAQNIPVGPSYQVPLARAVKQAVKIPVVAVGLITGFEQAEAIVRTGDADLVALARGVLFDPRWPWHAAAQLGGHVKAPEQYLRSQPGQFRDLFDFGQGVRWDGRSRNTVEKVARAGRPMPRSGEQQCQKTFVCLPLQTQRPKQLPATELLMAIRAVLFDIDGTLVDRNDLHVLAWEEAFATIGTRFDRQVIHDQIGKGTDMLVPTLLPHIDKAMKKVGEVHAEVFKTRSLGQVTPFPGARELLVRVRSAGQKVVLASSASADELDHYLGLLAARDLVEETTSADDVEHTKPAPDIFATALAEVAPLSAAEVLVVGDTPYDVEAAAKSGIATIAVRSGKFPDNVLRDAGAVALYDDVAAILAGYDHSLLA